MKKLALLVTWSICFGSSFAQFDSTQNQLYGNALKNYVGQEFYLSSSSAAQVANGYRGFLKDYRNSYSPDNIYHPTAKKALFSSFLALNGKYFTVMDVIRVSGGKNLLKWEDIYIKLREQDSGDTLYYDFKRGFPFLVVGFYKHERERLKNLECVFTEENYGQLIDMETKKPVNYVPDEVWKLSSLAIEESEGLLSALFVGRNGQLQASVLYSTLRSICIGYKIEKAIDTISGIVVDDSLIETPAEFPGGEEALSSFLRKEIGYPEFERDNGIIGTVWTGYTITETGEVTEIQTIKEVPNGPGLSNETIRLLRSMPKWEPAKRNGRPVRVRQVLPTKFSIANEQSSFEMQMGACIEDRVFTYVENAPDFKGGKEALKKYIATNLKYPEEEKKGGIEGVVFVTFLVDCKGKVTNARVSNEVKNGSGLSLEALRLINSMPDWMPGRFEGKLVKVLCKVPVRFSIGEEQNYPSNQLLKQDEGYPYNVSKDPSNSQSGGLEKNVFSDVQVFPEFPGGEHALIKFLRETIHYPTEESKSGVQGTVYLSFVIDTTGVIRDIKAVREVKGAPGLTREAIRVVSAMPNWIPAKNNGHVVACTFTLPVKFQIN